MDLASLLKRYRTAARLTQEELAERAEVSARTISDVERGLRTRIYQDTADRLMSALGLDDRNSAEFRVAARGWPVEAVAAGSPLPAPPTELIGRELDVETILAVMRRSGVRLVTLTGPGGVGKTRLAVEAARRNSSDRSVFFVQLSETTDARMVLPAIARAVGVLGRDDASVDAIRERISGAQALLVVDTFERVLPAALNLAELLESCESMTLIATSREALRIRGEHEIVVPTLDIESDQSPAAKLFIERATAVRPDLEIDHEIVADICRRLDGLPLAIELAAARTKHLTLNDLRDQLDHSLRVLTRGARDAPARQHTMRDTIRWSYELLLESEQTLFRNLCVFAGGWTIATASEVCTGSGEALSGMNALVDKSLVVPVDLAERRYKLLDVVREFGREIGPTEGAEDRHLATFVAIAEEAERHIGRSDQQTVFERLSKEHENIRAALRYAIFRSDGSKALRLSSAVWRYWLHQGDLSEGRAWLVEALRLDAPPSLRSKGLWGLAWLAYHQGDYEEAQRCSDVMLQLVEDNTDPVQKRNALTIRGIVDLAHERYESAIAALDQCVLLLRDLEPDWLMATSLLNLGMATLHARDLRADSILQRARALYGVLGDDHFTARTDVYLGYDALLRGDTEEAWRLMRTSLVSFWELDDPWGSTEALELASALAAIGGTAESAATIAGAAHTQRLTSNASPFRSDRNVVDRFLLRAQQTIDEASWMRATQLGISMTLEQAVDYALASSARISNGRS